MLAPAPGTRSHIKAIVATQMLAQIGAFALPALLPGYIARWDLSKTEAGWLVGIFFAAYVVMVPVLVSLTDRVPAHRQPGTYSCDLKVSRCVTSGASAILRMLAQVCL